MARQPIDEGLLLYLIRTKFHFLFWGELMSTKMDLTNHLISRISYPNWTKEITCQLIRFLCRTLEQLFCGGRYNRSGSTQYSAIRSPQLFYFSAVVTYALSSNMTIDVVMPLRTMIKRLSCWMFLVWYFIAAYELCGLAPFKRSITWCCELWFEIATATVLSLFPPYGSRLTGWISDSF